MVHWNKEYFDAIYDQYLLSGKTVRDFCKEDMHCDENRFYYWVSKKKKELSSKIEEQKSFIRILPTELNDSLHPSSEVTSLTIRTSELSVSASSSKKKLKLKYPNGVELEIEEMNDLDKLKQLITLI